MQPSNSGDMTKLAEDCGLFHQFMIPVTTRPSGSSFVELELVQPLSLEVGNDGIIGRRVSLLSGPSARRTVLAEGIVGFNYLQPAL